MGECSAKENTVAGVFYYPTLNKMNIIQDNEYIKGIILPNTLTSIGSYAFDYWTALVSITITAAETGFCLTRTKQTFFSARKDALAAIPSRQASPAL
jgi:hypothetical protein